MSTNLFVGKTDETKRKAKKARTKQSAATKHRPETLSRTLSTLSLSLLLLFSKQTSLSSTSLLLFRVGENNRALTHLIKRRRKSSKHKSRGVKKHEQRNCSESALFSLFCCFLSCAFSTKPYKTLVLFRPNRTRLFHPKSVEISSVSQQRSAFPHY